MCPTHSESRKQLCCVVIAMTTWLSLSELALGEIKCSSGTEELRCVPGTFYVIKHLILSYWEVFDNRHFNWFACCVKSYLDFVSLDLLSAWKENVSGILGEAEQQCVGALFLGRAWHQGTWQSSCTGFRQCCPPCPSVSPSPLGLGLNLPRGHPKAFLGLNEQVIIRYLVSKQCW